MTNNQSNRTFEENLNLHELWSSTGGMEGIPLDFFKVKLQNICFSHTNLKSGLFLQSNLEHATFCNSNLTQTAFINVNFKNACFTECDLSNAILIGTDLIGVVFKNVKIKRSQINQMEIIEDE